MNSSVQAQPYIVMEGVSKAFANIAVLHDISTQFSVGEVAVLLGSSGSGKSTLLRTINRLEPHDRGRIVVGGIEISDNPRALHGLHANVGMVFQQFNLFSHLSVMDNITLAPRRVLKLNRAQAQVQALELLKRVGMELHAHKYPWQLSGGQQQRIAIARALAMSPKVMLFDEPTSSLDPEMVKEVLDVMRELADGGMGMVVVTHEMGFAREVGDRILFMEQGRILVDAPPSQFFDNPANDRIRSFLGQIGVS